MKKAEKLSAQPKADSELPKQPQSKDIEVTEQNQGKLTVYFLNQIYNRLGYMIKLMEEKGK